MCNHSYWCEKCNVPLVTKRCGLCGQGSHTRHYALKPVFEKEHKIIDTVLKKLNSSFDLPWPVFRSRGLIYHKGLTVLMFKIEGGQFVIRKVLRPEMLDDPIAIDQKKYWKAVVSANRKALYTIEKEAIGFIKKVRKKNKEKEAFVSFSGGKDSAVTAYLVSKAIKDVPLLFSNTTIEFPETLEFNRKFAKKYGLRLIEKKPNRDFKEICSAFGPPSRFMRWCCSTQKAAPIQEFYREKEKQVLSFDGIRKYESSSRAKYERVHKNTKLTKQLSAYPIYDWTDLMIWLYPKMVGLELNPVYEWGYSRVGCWGCPNNTKYDDFLIKKSHPKISDAWQKLLIGYADKNDKTLDWVYDGLWKCRVVKYKYFEECTAQQMCSKGHYFTFKMKKKITPQLLEYLKVFGRYDSSDEKKGQITIRGKDTNITTEIGSKELSVYFDGDATKIWQTKKYLEKQLEKAFNCVHCGACIGGCPSGAIEVNGSFYINKEKCKSCLLCCTSKFIKQSCAAIHYKKQRITIKTPTVERRNKFSV